MPLDFPSTDAQPTPICPSILSLPQQATSQKPYSVNPISGTPSTKHFFRPLERHQSRFTPEKCQNCIFLKCCQSVTANRTATVKENCSFGLLFDHSSYVEAAAASIRATGQSRPRHMTIPTAAQPSDSPNSVHHYCLLKFTYRNILKPKENRHPISPKYHCILHYVPLFCLKVHFGIPFLQSMSLRPIKLLARSRLSIYEVKKMASKYNLND